MHADHTHEHILMRGLFLTGVTLVELVRTERLDAGLLAAVGECDEVEGDVEEGHLNGGRACRALG